MGGRQPEEDDVVFDLLDEADSVLMVAHEPADGQ